MPALTKERKQRQAQIKKLYKKYDNATGAKMMGMSKDAFRIAAIRAGAEKNNWHWTAAAEKFLLENFNQFTAKQMQEQLKSKFKLIKGIQPIYKKYSRLVKLNNQTSINNL